MPLLPDGAYANQFGQAAPNARFNQVPEETESPGFLDTAVAGLNESNVATAAFNRFQSPKPDAPSAPGFDPSVSIPKGYEPFAPMFEDARSPQDIEWYRQQVDAHLQNQRTISRAGFGGTVASIAAGVIDPVTIASMALPGGGESRIAQMINMAAINAGTSAVQETVMHQLNPNRTGEESLANISASAITGGILTGILAKVPKREFNRAVSGMREELGKDVPPVNGVGNQPLAQPASITDKFRTQLTVNPEDAAARYESIPDTQGGKVLNVDTARELSPDYLADRTQSAQVHEPASEFIKDRYASLLKQAPKAGEEPTVLFTAGGTGAGKSSGLKALGAEGEKPQIVYDTNMSNTKSAITKIDQALAAGKEAHIMYVYREPIEALENGALPRAMRQEGEFGSGRTVPIDEHIKTHVGSSQTVNELAEHYRDNPKVKITAIDNSLGKGEAKIVPLESLPKVEHTGLREKAIAKLDEARQSGAISEAVHQGFTGKSVSEVSKPISEGELPDLVEHPIPEESSVGAAASKEGDNRIARGARTITEGPIGHVAPSARTMSSPSQATRSLTEQLVNIPENLEKNYSGVSSASPVERELWKYEGTWNSSRLDRANQFKTYRERIAGEGGEPLTRRQFNTEISAAMRRGDKHAIPEVAESAKQTRAKIFDPLWARAKAAGLAPTEVALNAESYLMRQYDGQAIRANMKDWMDRLTKGYMQQGVDQLEARDIAHSITRNVLGSERGTMDWHVSDGVGESGRLKERTLNLPDTLLEPYLNSDIDHITHSYFRSLAPEVELTERFGSRDMKDQFADISNEYGLMKERALREGDNAKVEVLDKQQNADIRDLSGMRDRLYGIYGQPKDPGSFFVRAGRMLRSENALRLLGAATLSHFPDIANAMMKFGMPNTMTAIAKVLTSKEAMQLTRSEAQRMGSALDMSMNVTASLLGDYASHSQYAEQRFMNKATRLFTIVTGETPLITAVQGVTSTLAQDEIIGVGQKLAAGKPVSQNIIARYASGGLDKETLIKIADQHAQFGKEANGLKFGMSDTWTDQATASKFESAVLRDAHSVTLRPGAGDTPLFMSTELGKTILQFKSFGFAASRTVVNPILQGIAHGDPRAAQAVIALAFMGAASYVAKQKAANQPIDSDPAKFALEVADRSNMMGWTNQLIFPLLWQFGNNELSRWSDRDPVETIGGPTAGTIASIFEHKYPSRLLGNQEEPDQTFRRSDLHFMRRLAPAQNLWYMRGAINSAEDHMGNLFDLPGESNADRAQKTQQ